MKILAFAGSNSTTSINYQLIQYTTSLLPEHKIQQLDMSTIPFPMYSEQTEKTKGFTSSLQELREEIKNADRIIISANEHNGGPSAYFKNLLDWLSRLDRDFMNGKHIFLMSTSPGRGGAQSSRNYVETALTRSGGEVRETFSLPSFNQTFDLEKQTIIDGQLKAEHLVKLQRFMKED